METKRKLWNEFYFLSYLGRGAYGRVYKIQHTKTGQYYALKEVGICSRNAIADVLNERLPSNINHKNILKYTNLFISKRPRQIEEIGEKEYDSESRPSSGMDPLYIETALSDEIFDTFLDEEECLYLFNRNSSKPERNMVSGKNLKEKCYYYILSELCDFTLRNFLDLRNELFFESSNKLPQTNIPIFFYFCSFFNRNDKKVLNRHFFWYIFKEIVKGLAYLHSNDIVHSDIKPRNIFFVKKGVYVPKIGDFGLMKIKGLIEDMESYSDETVLLYLESQIVQQSFVLNTFDESIDVYDIGILYFEMLWPMKTVMERVEVIRKIGQFERLPDEFKEAYPEESEIIEQCIYQDSNKRLKARKLLEKVLKMKLNNNYLI